MLLALLSEGSKYGLQLREEFEAGTGEVWPLNVGQVYKTLGRLERDGLAESDGTGQEGPQKRFRITADGREALAAWLRTPPDLTSPPRDELVMKVLVAARVPGTDAHEVIQAHRVYLLELMQQWTRLKEGEARDDLSLALVVVSELFRLDAVIRWLDAAEVRLDRAAAAPPRPGPRPPRTRFRSFAGWGHGGEPAGTRRGRPQRGERAGAARGIKGLRRRRGKGTGAAQCEPVGGSRRDGRGHGAQRLGQVHAAHDCRQPGGTHERRGADRRQPGVADVP